MYMEATEIQGIMPPKSSLGPKNFGPGYWVLESRYRVRFA